MWGNRKPHRISRMGLGVAFLFRNKSPENDRGAILEKHTKEAAGPVQGI
jgi:hypothetical protein